ncbi:uncharacterized protein LOC115627935 [Scaptodrosophila lebanonensis]|uniref:Uncharacterized protein LOC115627935 n=1 Tax=Drosophila lebanonensis TaxID=7225 RepID=A0A6J2TX00_DROLE|nr:uncharacterized protein LOC115627935 [Scaptodrosophila lebanonensis]
MLPAARPALRVTTQYDDDSTPNQLRLEDLEREQEAHATQLDLNRPPTLPTHYEWRPSAAPSVPPSYVQDAARLERVRQLQLQHQQLSGGYQLQLSDAYLLLSPFGATSGITRPAPTPPTSTTLLKPIVPYEVTGAHYLGNNGLEEHPTAPSAAPPPSVAPPRQLFVQSKQFAYAPPHQRNYASGPRIPLPYPPSFISITTRRPNAHASIYAKPFRPSQPDPTPDLFAERASKSLLDSYIPSWEVVRLLQQHRLARIPGVPGGTQQHTLAYPLRLFKRDSLQPRHIVKKSLAGAQ